MEPSYRNENGDAKVILLVSLSIALMCPVVTSPREFLSRKLIDILQDPVGTAICGSDASTQATKFSRPIPKKMFLCPAGASGTDVKTSLADFHDSPSLVEQPAYIEKYKSLPAVFLHEMTHWLTNDHPSMPPSGCPDRGCFAHNHMYSLTRTVKNQEVDYKGEIKTAYSYVACFIVAFPKQMNRPDMATLNADSYRYVAVVVPRHILMLIYYHCLQEILQSRPICQLIGQEERGRPARR